MIHATELRRTFGDWVAVADVSLAIPRGEIFGLIGPDGAGKTTLMRMLAGLLTPTSGTAAIDNRSVTEGSEGLAATVGYMPQRFGLYADLTVNENLAFFANLRGIPRKEATPRMAELLAFVGLAEFGDRPAGALSGGMKQKLALATVLMHVPPVLLLDEPTNGVDPVSRRDFWLLLYKLVAERQLTLLVSTAFRDEAERCHRLAMMDGGRITALGRPMDLQAELNAGWHGHGGQVGASRALAPPSEPAVRIQGLAKHFGAFKAVVGLDLTVAPGEVFGFLGPNGAGKSTTIRMLCGLLAPSGGEGQVAGYDIRSQQAQIRARIGYMSQKFSLYDDLTVAENLQFFGRVYGVPQARLAARQAEVLGQIGLVGRENELTSNLAGGLKQRLALGAAIMHQPRIVVLDEPTSGTDAASRQAFWTLIWQMAGEGVTVFVTTHYMEEADGCDRLALIYRGELIALGTPNELKTAHPEAARDTARGTTLEDVFIALIEARNAQGTQSTGVA